MPSFYRNCKWITSYWWFSEVFVTSCVPEKMANPTIQPINVGDNIAQSWEAFKYHFKFYLRSIGKDTATTKVRAALLVNAVGEPSRAELRKWMSRSLRPAFYPRCPSCTAIICIYRRNTRFWYRLDYTVLRLFSSFLHKNTLYFNAEMVFISSDRVPQ